MTYSATGTIQAADFNGFANDGANNVGNIWGVGSGDKGWGQTAISNVVVSGTVTAATQWTSLIANLATGGSQTGTTMTSRTLPTQGATITALAAVATDINSLTNNRGNAVAIGTEYGTWTGNIAKLTPTGSGNTAWTLTYTQTVTFASANAARYFFNAGGIVRLKYGKSSSSTDIDPDWNALATSCGVVNLTGRVNSNSQLIAGSTYTGTTNTGSTGTPTVATTTGWWNLTGSLVTIFQQIGTGVYTGDYIRTQASTTSTVLTLVTTWVQPAVSGAGRTCNISGGTDTTSPNITIVGTAPTVLCTYLPPSTTYLSTASWGTPTIASSVAAS
jgi:hypothetical protein